MFFFVTITAVKISILIFYKKFSIATHIIATLCIMWLVAGLLVIIFGCHPVEANYVITYESQSHCVPFGLFIFTHELLNSLIDVAILAMPCFVVHRLQLSPGQKHQVIGIFLLGGLYVKVDPQTAY